MIADTFRVFWRRRLVAFTDRADSGPVPFEPGGDDSVSGVASGAGHAGGLDRAEFVTWSAIDRGGNGLLTHQLVRVDEPGSMGIDNGRSEPWLIAAIALLLGLVPCGACDRRRGTWRTAWRALQFAGVITTMATLLLAVGLPVVATVADIPMALAVLSFPSGLLFAHFLERWL